MEDSVTKHIDLWNRIIIELQKRVATVNPNSPF